MKLKYGDEVEIVGDDFFENIKGTILDVERQNRCISDGANGLTTKSYLIYTVKLKNSKERFAEESLKKIEQ